MGARAGQEIAGAQLLLLEGNLREPLDALEQIALLLTIVWLIDAGAAPSEPTSGDGVRTRG